MRRLLVLLLLGLVSCEPSESNDSPAPLLEIELLGCVDEPHPKDTCADFCEWDGAVCAENACNGITARNYPNESFCRQKDPVNSMSTTLGCEDVLVFAGS
ncbi:MAG TPA: hypothetical protein VK034_07370 [Enhygromyxa sp.]|nr:hypothetical protein [Enhygromyxa sp.]